MDAHVKADLRAFLNEERRSRDERSHHIRRMQRFIENFQEHIRDVIEPAMKEFIGELDGGLGLPTCEIHALPQQAVPIIRLDFQVTSRPVGLQGYNGEPLPCPSFTLRANEDKLKIEFEGEPGDTGSVDLEEVTDAWVQQKLLDRLKQVVAASR